MATSEARIRANQRNTTQSKEPKTDKVEARANALKYGLTSAVVLLPDEEQALNQRIEAWSPEFPAHNLEDHWMRRQLVQATLQIDHCQDQARQQRLYEARRALHCWDEDQAAQAEALGAKLSKNPSRTVAELRTSRAGADWLLQRWTKLDVILNDGVPFEEDQQHLILDLLGSPLATRPMDRDALAEMPVEQLRALIGKEVESLEKLLEKSLVEVEAFQRQMAEAGLPPKESAELKRIKRDESAHWRRYNQASSHWQARPPRQRPALGSGKSADTQDSKQAIELEPKTSPAPEVPPQAKPEPKTEQTQPQPQIQVDLFRPEAVPVFITGRPTLTRKQRKNLRKRFQPTS